MAIIPDSLRLTPEETTELAEIQRIAKEKHERNRKAALKRGRTDWPLFPFECSWAFEEQFRTQTRQFGLTHFRPKKTGPAWLR